MIWRALALEDGEWHQSGVVYDALPFTEQGIRNHLKILNERGNLEQGEINSTVFC